MLDHQTRAGLRARVCRQEARGTHTDGEYLCRSFFCTKIKYKALSTKYYGKLWRVLRSLFCTKIKHKALSTKVATGKQRLSKLQITAPSTSNRTRKNQAQSTKMYIVHRILTLVQMTVPSPLVRVVASRWSNNSD